MSSFADFLCSNYNSSSRTSPLKDFSLFNEEVCPPPVPPPTPKLVKRKIEKKKKFCIGQWVRENRKKKKLPLKKPKIVQIQSPVNVVKPKSPSPPPSEKPSMMKIVQIMPPVKCKRKSAPHKRWLVQFKYRLGDNPKIHSKTVAFGEKSKSYYVDHGDKMRRNVDTRRVWQRHLNDPSKKQFWECHLLQSKPTPQEAYLDMIINIT